MAFETDPEGHVVNDFSRWECVGGDGNIGCVGEGTWLDSSFLSRWGAKGLFLECSAVHWAGAQSWEETLKTWMWGWDSDMEETQGSQNITRSLSQMGADREVSG